MTVWPPGSVHSDQEMMHIPNFTLFLFHSLYSSQINLCAILLIYHGLSPLPTLKYIFPFAWKFYCPFLWLIPTHFSRPSWISPPSFTGFPRQDKKFPYLQFHNIWGLTTSCCSYWLGVFLLIKVFFIIETKWILPCLSQHLAQSWPLGERQYGVH